MGKNEVNRNGSGRYLRAQASAWKLRCWPMCHVMRKNVHNVQVCWVYDCQTESEVCDNDNPLCLAWNVVEVHKVGFYKYKDIHAVHLLI